DAVVCNLGLMFFPEPARGLSEFRRVLRPSGRAAVSVNTVPERSYNHQINVILTRYVPGLAEAVTRTFSWSAWPAAARRTAAGGRITMGPLPTDARRTPKDQRVSIVATGCIACCTT